MRPDQFQALVEEMQLEAWTSGVEQERKRCIDFLRKQAADAANVLASQYLNRTADLIEKGKHGKD